MRAVTIAALLVALAGAARADDLVYGTPRTFVVRDCPCKDSPLDIVLLPEGYTAPDLGLFARDAAAIASSLVAWDVIAPVASRVRVLAVNVVSTEPLSSDGAPRATSFKLKRLAERLLAPGDPGAVEKAAKQAAKHPLAVVIVANTARYGGSGGEACVTTNGPEGLTHVLLHEFSHTAFGLGDEYDSDGAARWDGREPSEPNLTKEPSPARAKWSRLAGALDAENLPVGTYEGGHAGFTTGIFRPVKHACLMHDVEFDLCPVCREAAARRLGSR